MEFQKQNLIDFLNISLQTIVGQSCGEQTIAVNNLPKSYLGLEVKASVGMGTATLIPWISFTGYNQKTSNGIYPVLLFYRNHNLLIAAYGISAENKPTKSWSLHGLKTLNQYFTERYLNQKRIEKKYNASFVHSVFPIHVIDNKLDESSLNVDEVFKSLNDLCEEYKRLFEKKIGTVFDTNPHEVVEQITFNMDTLINSINQTGLFYEYKFIQRYVCSLMTKPFVILLHWIL